MKSIQLLPNASSLIESLRDIGYSFESAIADIIDNSITAKSKKIRIYFDFEDKKLSLAIIDDGHGMTDIELLEAMRAGSQNPLDKRSDDDLGRFGLGLKTASFSQCRKLTVVSSKNNIKHSAKWDLDFVAQEEDWSLQILDNSDISNVYKIDSLTSNGTLVLWEDTDRIIDTEITSSIEKIINEEMEILQKHLELVFHRFLSGKNKISIYINDIKLKAFDPFFKSHDATQELSLETISDGDTKILIQPYILPHHTKVTKQEYEYYAGIGGYLKNQGFYVYRNRRLLVSGTWFRIRPQSELYKLARIQIDLPNSLDSVWKIDVKKSNASPPSKVRNRLKNIIENIIGPSSRVYTSKGNRSTLTDNAFWQREAAKGEIKYLVNKEHLIMKNFSLKLNRDMQYEFTEILDLISKYFPKDALYADLGSKPKQVLSDTKILDIELEDKAILLYENDILDIDNIKILHNTEPFDQYSKDWEVFFTIK